MLVLTRKASQVIRLGEDITITVVRTSHGSVKLGIEAPPSVRIMRNEIDEACQSRDPDDSRRLVSAT